MVSHEAIDRERAAYREMLARSLEQVVATLSSLDEVERISLFGSYTRGEADLFTDLDLLVVMRTELGFVERLRKLYRLLSLPVDVDIICYTPEEFESMRARPFLKQALKGEVVLYEKKCA